MATDIVEALAPIRELGFRLLAQKKETEQAEEARQFALKQQQQATKDRERLIRLDVDLQEELRLRQREEETFDIQAGLRATAGLFKGEDDEFARQLLQVSRTPEAARSIGETLLGGIGERLDVTGAEARADEQFNQTLQGQLFGLEQLAGVTDPAQLLQSVPGLVEAAQGEDVDPFFIAGALSAIEPAVRQAVLQQLDPSFALGIEAAIANIENTKARTELLGAQTRATGGTGTATGGFTEDQIADAMIRIRQDPRLVGVQPTIEIDPSTGVEFATDPFEGFTPTVSSDMARTFAIRLLREEAQQDALGTQIQSSIDRFRLGEITFEELRAEIEAATGTVLTEDDLRALGREASGVDLPETPAGLEQ